VIATASVTLAEKHGAVDVLIWTGNACYFSRFLIQWIASERARKTVAPRLFWWLSVLGAIFAGSYTWLIGEPVLFLSYVLALAIYLRNLTLGKGPKRRPAPLTWTLSAAVVLGVTLVALGMRGLRVPTGEGRAWTAVAVIGASIWSSRFVVQWLKSERRGESYFPKTFWWLSLVGNALLLAYVCHIRNIGLIAGYAIGPLVQVRNLMIAYSAKGRARAQGETRAPIEVAQTFPDPADIEACDAGP